MIEYRLDGPVAVIELNRDEARNALNYDMIDGLEGACDRVATDSPRVVLITGRGRAFCAGADLKGPLFEEDFIRRHVAMLGKLQAIEVPVIAAINGPAMGAGLQLAMAADVRVMDPRARIGIPAAKIGVGLDNWTIKRLVSLIGSGHARSLLYCLDEFDAHTCAALGFANRIGDVEQAMNVARMMAMAAPLTYRHYKLVLSDDGALDPESDTQRSASFAAWMSEDLMEAKAARELRRYPVFQGK